MSYKREWYWRQRASGRCVDCPRPSADRARCFKCRLRNAKWMWTYQRKAA